PESAPPVPFEGKYDRYFIGRVLLALLPPLALIFIVLGSILLGVATVNQAGAIGAIGAMIMASYRLMEGKPRAYYPAALAIVSIAAILILLSLYNLNIKNITNGDDLLGVILALIAVSGLVVSIIWSIWRAHKINDTLNGVMIDTAKTTSMVFIILIGAAMLTSAFRAFGGEELVKEYLTSLPGGFWTQFIVVMAVIFFLGFFLDFIEIAVVVVPIVAPILLADPQANVTAVWLGVMIGLNIQTSFLTPPFGFSLFYLRGVAPPSVKTTHIYKGAVSFIGLQLLGLAIAGSFPSLVNYLPNKTHLTSETAPPPSNPKLQRCMESDVFAVYEQTADSILARINQIKDLDTSYIPSQYQSALSESYAAAEKSFGLIREIQVTESDLKKYTPDYEPLHRKVRAIQIQIRALENKANLIDEEQQRLAYEEGTSEHEIEALKEKIVGIQADIADLEKLIPEQWKSAREQYVSLAKHEKTARQKYRRNADDSYEAIITMQNMIADGAGIKALAPEVEALRSVIRDDEPKQAMETIKALGAKFDLLKNAHPIKSKLTKARRALRGKNPDREKAESYLEKAVEALASEVSWRSRAASEYASGLEAYRQSISQTIGLRMQERLTQEQAESIASCLSVHKDVSLSF
ncbi:MAG: TRAP transporter large permease subunit, partial [Gammaproteobacteria bacterium]|nr:TRAP transporter large permease subunit [Gammaproteobacteria bacterium]